MDIKNDAVEVLLSFQIWNSLEDQYIHLGLSQVVVPQEDHLKKTPQ